MELPGFGDAHPIFTTDSDADCNPGCTIDQTGIQRQNEFFSLAPIQKLPWELLSTIFLLCHRGDHRPSPAAAPLLLSAICTGWRSVALGTPQLWNKLKLHLSSSDANVESDLNLSMTWIERSGSAPLSVDISIARDETMRQHPVVDLLIRHSRRLQKICASFLTSLIVPLARIAPGSLDRLEDLELNLGVDNYFDRIEELEDLKLIFAGDHLSGESGEALGGTPHLRSVKLRCNPLFGVPRMALPWTQLTVLVIEGFTMPRASSLYYLTKCVNLEYCSLQIVGWRDDPDPDFENDADFPVVGSTRLKALHTLNLDFHYCGATSQFYQALILPSLKDLSLKHVTDSVSPLLPVCQLQLRSGFELKRLCLTSITDSPGALTQILMPSIVDLELNYPSWGLDWFIHRLTYSTSKVPVLPNLQRLTVRGTNVDENRIADLVESRWWIDDDIARPISRLQSLSLESGRYACDDVNVAAQARIKKCQAEGLEYNYHE